MSEYKSHREVIEAFGAKDLAKALNISIDLVYVWKSRGKIPNKYHWKIATKRKSRTLNINMRLLEKLSNK